MKKVKAICKKCGKEYEVTVIPTGDKKNAYFSKHKKECKTL